MEATTNGVSNDGLQCKFTESQMISFEKVVENHPFIFSIQKAAVPFTSPSIGASSSFDVNTLQNTSVGTK